MILMVSAKVGVAHSVAAAHRLMIGRFIFACFLGESRNVAPTIARLSRSRHGSTAVPSRFLKARHSTVVIATLAFATAAALASPASAQDDRYPPSVVAPVVGGAVVGTVVDVGAYNGWWDAAALPATAVGAAVTGGVAGVGAMALIDAAVQPCRGFHALFGLNAHECIDGVYVGNQPRRADYVPRRRHVR